MLFYVMWLFILRFPSFIIILKIFQFAKYYSSIDLFSKFYNDRSVYFDVVFENWALP